MAVTILKALFIALGRDENIINDVRMPSIFCPVLSFVILWLEAISDSDAAFEYRGKYGPFFS